jgi:hypothetical protein
MASHYIEHVRGAPGGELIGAANVEAPSSPSMTVEVI